jgi:hypothetical protein
LGLTGAIARASTYVVFIPLDDPIYNELDTLNGLGLLDSYQDEIKPISRVEAARLTIEADRHYHSIVEGAQGGGSDDLAKPLLRSLRQQLHEEVAWLEHHQEDNLPNLLQPVQRAELQYVFSDGTPRANHTSPSAGINFDEATPLLPNNDALPTSPGSNEIARVSSWAGFGSFFTLTGEGAAAGPFTHGVEGPRGADVSRFQPLGAEAVVSLGNVAISFGQEEMWWGVGHFAPLSQGDNAAPFQALRVQGIHPTHLPFFLKYLGLFRWQMFFGQLDDDRTFAHPWIDGQNFAFKPLPNFEFGFTHAIQFGGVGNDRYSYLGFLGRATGFSTGSPLQGNTNSRAGVYLKDYMPKFRNSQFYFELLGEDNLTKEVPFVGRFLPFLATSFQGGWYLPRLTRDGLTDLRIEWAILEPNYSQHSDSLYWTYDDRLMADPMGPNASEVDVQVGRWFMKKYKTDLDVFYTERAQIAHAAGGRYKEHSVGAAIDLWTVPGPLPGSHGMLVDMRARNAYEYVQDINFTRSGSFRTLFMLSFGITPNWDSIKW